MNGDGERVRLTKRVVESVRKPAAGRISVFDSEVKGFLLRVTANDARSYYLCYRLRGRQRWLRIGGHPDLTPDEARNIAVQLRGDIARGKDPVAERAAARTMPTVRELAARY